MDHGGPDGYDGSCGPDGSDGSDGSDGFLCVQMGFYDSDNAPHSDS